MSLAPAAHRSLPLPGIRYLPVAILFAACIGAVLLLLLPITLPIGPMYWDLVVYVDGAQRVLTGQVPSIDFFAPVGPLGYWILAAFMAVFENGHPLLMAQWSLLLVTAPPMALVLWTVSRTAPVTALALLLPFLFFQLLPMNVEQYSTYPSVDGYGIYNRQVSEILYILTAALMFVRAQRPLLMVIAWCCLALFLLKVTGFVAGGLICAFAFLAGRVALSATLWILAIFIGALAAFELLGAGLVSAYVADIAALVVMNGGALLPRFLQAGSIHFGILAPIAFLGVTLLWLTRSAFRADLSVAIRQPTLRRIASVFDRDLLWLAVVAFAGLFFETQNTGGQALIFVWPVLLAILLTSSRFGGAGLVTVLTLVAATALPPLVNVAHRSSRAAIGQMNYVTIPTTHLKGLGAVTQRPEVVERAGRMLEAYAAFPQTYQFFADVNQLPSFTLYTELDFQAGWMMSVDEATAAILAYEAANGVRFETILSLNFANPFPYVLDRGGPRHVAIGADPFRAVPPPDEETLEAVAQTDLILYPTCPITVANERLLSLYEPAMSRHRPLELTPCWRAYLR